MIYIASDHAGFELKTKVFEKLSKNFKCVDLGPFDLVCSVDYPDYAHILCHEIHKDIENSVGILICGSGIGMSIAANRHPYIRSFVAFNDQSVELARRHNNVNVLCLGARMFDEKDLFRWIDLFLNQKFEGGRHIARVQKLNRYDQ
ncbi:MAG: ribose 5-phosphate isomerase B [Candidatus Puniceispirillum sp.]|nr:ribose 5-phosphate isomerase B [Candidatus Pelagibacter sp.]MBA4283649.1 ribose 5-phosphate isomerase B [Candidatus Puniceispirillum sp.]